MVKINLEDFKPVQVVRANGLVLLSGGHLRKEYPLHTKDVKLGGSFPIATFVSIKKNRCVAKASDYGKASCGRLDLPGCAQRLTR